MVAKPITLVIVLLMVSATSCCLAQQTYYVKPDPNTPCETNFPCHTLDHYVANSTFYFHSNTTLVFLPGRFHLSQEVFISDLEGFALLGSTQYKNTSGTLNGVPEPSTEIYCTGLESGAFGFYDITNLYISNFVFTYCGYVGRSHITVSPTPALYFLNIRDISVVGVVVQNSTTVGMVLQNVAGNVTIYGSTFMFNSGNLVIAVDQDVDDCTEQDRDLSLTIQSSQILFGSNSSGFILTLNSPCHNNTMVDISDVIFTGNVVPTDDGGNMHMEVYMQSTVHIAIDGCYFAAGKARLGGGLMVLFAEEYSEGKPIPVNTSHSVSISNSQFVSNQAMFGGGGVAVQLSQSRYHKAIRIKNVTFDSNVCLSPECNGGAIILLSISRSHFLLVEDSYISGGAAGHGGGIALQNVGSRNVQAVVMISNTTIVDNYASNYGGGIFILFVDLSPDIPQLNHTLLHYDVFVHVKNGTLERNTCLAPQDRKGIGGAVGVFSNTSARTFILIEDSYMADGAARYGGGIAARYASNTQAVAVISNTIIEHNSASQGGGGITFTGSSNVDVYITNTTTISNSANHGGNIYIWNGVRVNISCSYIANGSARITGGGIFIDIYWTDTLSQKISNLQANLNISDTHVVNNTALLGGGLCLINDICSTKQIDIVRTIFSRNHAHLGGNIFMVDCAATRGTTSLKNCSIQYGIAGQGAGLVYWMTKCLVPGIPALSTCHLQKEEMLYISRTFFLDNHSRYFADIDISIDMYQRTQGSLKIVRFEKCKFISSSTAPMKNHPVMIVDGRVDPTPEAYNKFDFFLEDIVFQGESGSAIVELRSLRKITFSNCSFIDNNATALMASSSNIFIEGSLLFRNNVGYNGGALALFDNSMLFLHPNTHIQFIGNSAMHAGGAIYVDQAPIFLTVSNPCFFQIKLSNTSLRYIDHLETYNISIDLVNNTAIAAGSALYGGSVDSCGVYFSNSMPASETPELNLTNHTYSTYFNELFTITTPCSDYSPISSDPIGVCFCQDDEPDCENETLTNSTYPGALVVASAVVVGQRNGVVRDGIVLTNYTGSLNEDIFTGKTSIIGGNLCQNVAFHMYSPPGSVSVTFRPGGKENLRYFTRKLQVSVLPCPLGFVLWKVTDRQYTCDCIGFLKDYTVRCNIDDQTFQRPPNVWIGTSCTNLSTTEVCRIMAHNYCPFQYCKPQQTELTLNDSDFQCNLNHSGILCGGCGPGHSLVLGTSRCLQCSNKFLSLFLVFLLAGLALVFLLMLCNMTVSDGTINGLIFYANVVGINSATFFPSGQENLFTSFLSVFIAWINLDLGIETCFYDRMDMYQKTWLQFAFPLYIWAIVLFLITTTHYFVFAAKVLIRRNAVKALATLFLLSFAKILHTTIAALSFVILKYSDGSNKAVWLYDGNINYLTGKHIPLFVVALLVFVLLILPYTVVLTFSQCIQRKTNYPLFSWYTRLRLQPLFDAYAGPYKDRYRFWSGLLVTVRIV